MTAKTVYLWKQAPFIRFLLPLIGGIINQWYFQWPVRFGWILLVLSLLIISLHPVFSIFQRFRLAWMRGLGIFSMLYSLGTLLTWYHDIRHNPQWFGHYLKKEYLIASIGEPPVDKPKSFKANACVNYLILDGRATKTCGKIIIYFNKDSLPPGAEYGSLIIFNKPLQEIKNAGNPGGFDYKTFSLFQDITHQVFLRRGEFRVLNVHGKTDINGFLYAIRESIVSILRRNIKEQKESGLAEALLIGYKDDLDRSLVQSYASTGVVHIIAISGMHLALVYWLINLLLKPIERYKRLRWLKPLLAVSLLWLFSLLTGASASVVRAAVMFTFLIVAEGLSKKSAIYNTLAASAFCLLCYDPFWLWDVGFQLSYAAVLSIVVFMKPIYHLVYFKNKLLDSIWKLNAVTFAAQILTTPLSIYYFHQFPVYFFLANFVAVPLSSIIVLGEILLCAISFFPGIALLLGKAIAWLIGLMNSYVQRVESLPGSLWDGLHISIFQAILLYAIIVALSFWLMEKIKHSLTIAMLAILGFVSLRSYSFFLAQKQQTIIVYNLPQHLAIDFIYGRHCYFWGDSDLLSNDFAINFHLKPARLLYRVTLGGNNWILIDGKLAEFKNQRILIVDESISTLIQTPKMRIDLLVLSKSPRITVTQLANQFMIRQIVFDGSVPFWKLAGWRKECDSLHIPYHDVNEKGAYIRMLN